MGLLRTPLRWSGALVLAGVDRMGADGAAAGYPDLGRWPQRRRPRPRRPPASDADREGRVPLQASGSRRMPIARTATDASLADGVSCDEAGCVDALADGGLVALGVARGGLADDCVRAVLVVTARQAPADCAASVIDQDRLRRQGALALRRRPAALRWRRSGRAVSTGHGRRRWQARATRWPLLARPSVPATGMRRRRRPICRRRSRRLSSEAQARRCSRARARASRSGSGWAGIGERTTRGPGIRIQAPAGSSNAPRWNSLDGDSLAGSGGNSTSVNIACGNCFQTARSDSVTVR